MNKYLSHKFKFIFLLVFLVACGTGINLFSEQDEVQLGEQFDKEIHENPKEYPIYKGNPAVKNYIQSRIFDEILQSPEVQKETVYDYKLEIIDNDSTLNAFAVPGGYVYLYTGLIKYLDSEAALAGVLAHEIAHVERRHATQRITNAYGLQLLASLALGNNPSQISAMVANLFSGLTLLANSRSAEDESDKYAIIYLSSTRYYPGGVKFFFERLRDDGKVSSSGGGIQTFLSTHPDPIDRINTTEQRLRERGLEIRTYTDKEHSGIYREEYQKNIKSKI
jgi:predicted Zn-dependent protease